MNDSSEQSTPVADPLAPLRRFRIAVVRYSLAGTLLVALAGYRFDPHFSTGAFMGGIAGVLGFWIIAVRLEKLAFMAPEKVNFAALTWTTFRFALYGVVLVRAYYLDRDSMHGMFGAVVGILVVRAVLMFLGITGIDMPNRRGQVTDD